MFIMFVLFLPIYALLIWTYKNPKESLLWGKRSMFKEEPEIKEEVLKNTKLKAIIGLIFISVMLLIGMLLIYSESNLVFL